MPCAIISFVEGNFKGKRIAAAGKYGLPEWLFRHVCQLTQFGADSKMMQEKEK